MAIFQMRTGTEEEASHLLYSTALLAAEVVGKQSQGLALLYAAQGAMISRGASLRHACSALGTSCFRVGTPQNRSRPARYQYMYV